MNYGKLLLAVIFSATTVIAEVPVGVSGQVIQEQLKELKSRSLDELKAMRKSINDARESTIHRLIRKVCDTLGIISETTSDIMGELMIPVVGGCLMTALYNCISFSDSFVPSFNFLAGNPSVNKAGMVAAGYLVSYGVLKIIGRLLRDNQQIGTEERLLLSQYDITLRNLDYEIEKLESMRSN